MIRNEKIPKRPVVLMIVLALFFMYTGFVVADECPYYLDDLIDVDARGANDRDFLRYNALTANWTLYDFYNNAQVWNQQHMFKKYIECKNNIELSNSTQNNLITFDGLADYIISHNYINGRLTFGVPPFSHENIFNSPIWANDTHIYSTFHGDGGNLTNLPGGSGGNPFNQDLNTTDDVVFHNLTSAYTTFINNTEITNGTFKITRDEGNLLNPVFRIDGKLGGGVIQGMLFDLDATAQAVAGLVMDGYLRDITAGQNTLWGLRYDISDKTPYQNTGNKNYYGVQVDHATAQGSAGDLRYINFYSLMGGCQHLGGSQDIEAYGFRNAFDQWANYDFGGGQTSDITAYGFYTDSPTLNEFGLGVIGTKEFYGIYLNDMNGSAFIDKGVAIQTNGGEHIFGDDTEVQGSLTMDELVLPTSAPGTPVAGSVYLNTTTNLIGTYDGSSWYWR